MNKKKKIKILTINLDIGGAEKVVVSKINYFLKKSFICELYLLQNLIRYKLPKSPNFKIYNYYSSFKNKLTFFRDLFIHIRFLKKNFNSKDTVISHLNRANYINILSSIFLTNHKTIVVIHNHPNHYIHSFSFIKSYYKFIVHYFIQMILYRFANEIVTISNESKLFYKHYFFLDTNLIYNPIDLNFTKKINTSYQFNKNINNRKYFLSVGRLSKGKNQIEILKTFLFIKKNDKELYNKIFLYIAGDGEKMNFLKKFISNNNLKDSIKIVGLIDDLAPFYNNSHCLISSAKSEALPNIFVESQSFNKPIITSNYSGYYESLTDNFHQVESKIIKATKLKYGIVYSKGDIEQLYKSIKIMINNKNYYSSVVKDLKLKKNLFSISNTNQYIYLLQKNAYKDTKNISIAHIIPNMNYGGVEVGIYRSIKELNKKFDYKVYTVKTKGVMNVNQKNILLLLLNCFTKKNRPIFIITSLWWSHPFGIFLKIFGLKWISFFHSSQYAHIIDLFISKIASKFSNYNFFDSRATLQFHIKNNLLKKNYVIPYLFKNETKINKMGDKDIDFIFVGRNHPLKRLDLVNYLIKILSLKIKKANFVCIVAGNQYPPFNKLISSIDIEIKYNLRNSEVLNYLKRSKFYIQLSEYEGMSMTAIEAIQNSVLPIIRPVGELINILDDSNSIIIKGDNKIDLDNALEKIVKIYNDKKSMEKISILASKKLNNIPYYTNTISKNINQIYSIN